MKFVIDNRIPFIKNILEPFAEVIYTNGSDIIHNHIIDADALIVRTRTKINGELLKNTNISFVGSTTIGTDHIDTEWCSNNEVTIASAPGCNSGSVAQYIASALTIVEKKLSINPGDTTIGVVGVGNVGKKVAAVANTLGYRVLLNDPPRARSEGSDSFVSLEQIAKESDIISLHVPLTFTGVEKTYHLINSDLFDNTKDGLILINTSRGDVINEEHLIKQLNTNKIQAAILDVWQSEPNINIELLKKTFLATPHIAGYSIDGKFNATRMILNSLGKHFELPVHIPGIEGIPDPEINEINVKSFRAIDSETVGMAILHTYQIEEDHRLFMASPDNFEIIRNTYGIRREFHAYKVSGAGVKASRKLKDLGFQV